MPALLHTLVLSKREVGHVFTWADHVGRGGKFLASEAHAHVQIYIHTTYEHASIQHYTSIHFNLVSFEEDDLHLSTALEMLPLLDLNLDLNSFPFTGEPGQELGLEQSVSIS